MKLSNRIFNNPNAGVYNHRKPITVLDTTAIVLPSSPLADGIILQENDRALFTGLLDVHSNNKVYKVQNNILILAVDSVISSGEAQCGDVLYVLQGTHANELWGYEGTWEILDVDITDTQNLINILGTETYKLVCENSTIEFSDQHQFAWWGDTSPSMVLDGRWTDGKGLLIGSKDINVVDNGSTNVGILTGSNTSNTTGGGFGSGDIYLNTGDVSLGTKKTGQVSIATGISDSNQSGGIFVYTGDSNTGQTGTISLATGTTSGARGKIRFKNGSEGTVGHIWKSSTVEGDGNWEHKSTLVDAEYSIGNSGTTKTIDFQNSINQAIILTDNCTITLANPINGQTYLIRVVQGGIGSYTVNWGSILWLGGVPPVLSTAVGAIDIITLYYNGISYYGNYGVGYA